MIFMVQVFYISSEIKHMKQFLWQTGHCILIYESILTQHFSNVNLQNTIVILVGIIEMFINVLDILWNLIPRYTVGMLKMST